MKYAKVHLAFIMAFFICILLSTVSLDKKSENIRQEVLRLHVIAASDSEQDQKLKLQLRDELLIKGKEAFADSKNKQQAEEKIKKALPYLKQTAQSFVNEKGYDYKVDVRLEKSFFPTKSYGGFTLPAGNYNALRVIIDKGEGQNWWCVMFPPLCLPAAEKDSVKLSDVLTDGEMEIVTDRKYEVRLWLVEKWQELINRQ
ncbi:MAG: stage II sporulation protein R [Acutalibacteraceae bacterium]